jgi:hypothetical protein
MMEATASGLTLNRPMLVRGFLRLWAGRYISAIEASSRDTVVCDGEVTVVPPAIYDSKSMEKVSGLSPWRRWEFERRLMDGGPMEHHATVAHEINNVDVVEAYMYSGASKSQPGYGAERLLLRDHEPLQRLDRAVLTSSKTGSHYFGHVLLDDLPLSLLAQGVDAPPVSVVSRGYLHEAGYRALCSTPAGRLVRRARIKRLTVFTDFGQNRNKEVRYRALRANLRRHLAGVSPALGPGVYIRRGRTGELRLLANEPQVEQFLAGRGFRIVDTETMSSEAIAAATLDARIVVSVEGSQFSHCIYSAADEAVFLVLQPPDRFSMVYKEFTDRMGMGFAFLVGESDGEGFCVSLYELERMLGRLSKWW